jgi:hypothetical protein
MLAISSEIVFTPYPRSSGTSSGTNLKSFFNYVLEKEKVGKGLKENGKGTIWVVINCCISHILNFSHSKFPDLLNKSYLIKTNSFSFDCLSSNS